MIEICARSDANVLLCGETGVGKDLIASLIHRHSRPPVLPVHQGRVHALPQPAHRKRTLRARKGSFTGAEQQRLGRFELAEGGSLYLDDVDDIPIDQQAKLLRAIEEKILERLGGGAPIKADVRIIASTKLNLLERISAGAFRQDPVLPLGRPAREHPRRCGSAATTYPLSPSTFSSESPKTARPASIPTPPKSWNPTHGQATCASCSTSCSASISSGRAPSPENSSPPRSTDAAQKRRVPAGDFQTTIAQTERELLENALHAAGGIKTAAASALGMKPTTFRDKLAKYGLG